MERRSDKIAIYPPPPPPDAGGGGDKSIDYSKFAIRDFRPRARRTRTSAGGDAGEREGRTGRRRARRVKPSRNGFAISYESLVTE